MKDNFTRCLALVLKHEGGYVNHPKDPGGATNKGITIGTLKSVGIDVDGDGDSDIVDLKNLRQKDLEFVYRKFYWDCVKGDELPSGVDYAAFDLAVNSGVGRSVKFLQRAVGVTEDGVIGPMTMIKIKQMSPAKLAGDICDIRLKFLMGLKTWATFGKGWGSRVKECRAMSVSMAAALPVQAPKPVSAPVVALAVANAAPAPSLAPGKVDIPAAPKTGLAALLASLFSRSAA